MKQILQNMIPESKDITDVLDACRRRPLLDVQKLLAAAQPDMERKRLACLIYNKHKRSFLVDMKKILKTFLSTSIPADMEKNGKPFIHFPMITLSEILKFHKEFSVPVSPNINNFHTSHSFFNSVSKIIPLLMKKHGEIASTFTIESSDHLNYSKGDSGHTNIPPGSLRSHISSPSCDPQNFSCKTEVLQPGRKRSSSLSSELDKEFAHLPEAALKFLFYSPVSCPSSMNEPLIHHVDSRILNSLSVQPSWLPYQPKEPVGGCPTQLWPHINPDRIWPRILLTAKCVCDGSQCALHGTHRCITIKVAVVSLIRGSRGGRDQARNVWRQWEMVAVGCVCAEHKSVLLHEHRPRIYV
ncbi:hypothetical protein B7P43_G11319 [Cryptotermes secundus]|uniref:Uncharacterized protein n=1 Tax=Cryptotermes secundus TaxID=105785 RepID=A0A2J7RAB8_9NEOP|nr:hypothetical protein B7P43_G11319 [Cryptotermes secundus]